MIIKRKDHGGLGLTISLVMLRMVFFVLQRRWLLADAL